jgi:deoxyribonuclease V
MRYRDLHGWDLSPSEAIQLQKELQGRIRLEPLEGEPELIAGADVSYERFSDVIFAGFVVLSAKTLKVVARSAAVVETHFPYIPGLLSFREAPALLKAWENLKVTPDLVFFDGQGIAHPRRLGIAAHMGLWIDRPSVGCAKSLLVGSYKDLALEPRSQAPLIYRGEGIGVALRTKASVKPVFISPGNRIDTRDSVRETLRTLGRYRIPEPTRQAHLWANELRRSAKAA